MNQKEKELESPEQTAARKEAMNLILKAKTAMATWIIGQERLLERLLIALLTDGHVLIEGVPGLAKTLAVNALAQVTSCTSNRIQFTPDLLPADLIGTEIFNPQTGQFKVRKGPIFTQILLADEINRAPGKVQSALLEVMQERQVTIAGETFPLAAPYLVVATQNPIEQEGTYPLPEAQTDRFLMKVSITYPSFEEEKRILARWGQLEKAAVPAAVLSPEQILSARGWVNSVYVDPKIIDYILRIVFASRDPKQYGVDAEGLIMYGASPRATIALKIASQAHAFLNGRNYVLPSDVQSLAHDVLRHRIRPTYEAESEEVTSDILVDRILKTLPAP